MRINLNYVNAFLINSLIRADAIIDVEADGMDIIIVRTGAGEAVSIHLVERDIDLAYLKEILEDNHARKRGTLFILWAAMLLPDPGSVYKPYDWMAALVTLYGGKIYGFEVWGEEVEIFPVFFDRQPASYAYYIRHGEQVRMRDFASQTIYTDSPFLRGNWRIADFDGFAPKAAEPQAEAWEQTRQSHVMHDRNPISAYYEVLGVALNADMNTIRKAYRQLARQFHPDLNPDPGATEHMKRLNHAYQRILAYLSEM